MGRAFGALDDPRGDPPAGPHEGDIMHGEAQRTDEGSGRTAGASRGPERAHRATVRTRDALARPTEHARFLDRGDDQLYAVTHVPLGAMRGSVLLCGPFGVERERAYATLVTWARSLAARGFAAMRFDYGGLGESTGCFERMSLSRWREDAAFAAEKLAELTRGVPLVLHGVRLGALVAAELFATGVGDALLVWEPPASAEEHLRETLRHNLIHRRVAGSSGAPARTRAEEIAALEAGELVDVDGYRWSRELWTDARSHALVLPSPDDARPWLALRCTGGGESEPDAGEHERAVEADAFWESSAGALVPPCEGFFRASLRWLDDGARAGDARESAA